jgi:hypothetical protein
MAATPRFLLVVIIGKDRVRPRTVRLKPSDFLCFVNPTGKTFTIRFPDGSPLSRTVGRVRAGSPSNRWYQLSKRAIYGHHYRYTVRVSAALARGGPTGGPEIVPDG